MQPRALRMLTTAKFSLAIVLSFALHLGGCAGIPTRIPKAAPANYRQLAANSVAALPKLAGLTPASISSIQQSQGAQSGDWRACIRLNDGRLYGVFYQDNALTDIRLAIAADCKGATDFHSLPVPAVPDTVKSK